MSDVVFTVSARGKLASMPVMEFLERNYPGLAMSRIDSLFGFVERCSLYGGRPFVEPQLSDDDVRVMNEHGVGLRLPLTNHYVDRDEYKSYWWLLEKYHAEGNSIIATNDDLASWVRVDFPQFKLEASVIKNIDTYDQIAQALDLYDTVVLPMRFNEDADFLERVEPKSRITLFANAGCALTCPSKICYPAISKMNKFTGENVGFSCSSDLKDRDGRNMVDFDLNRLVNLGFHRFKLLRARPSGKTGY